MVLTESHRAALDKILSVDEIIDVSHPDYLSNTETWSAQKNCKPGRVLRPRTLSSLQDTVKYLCDTKEINFAVRSGGVGSSSAPDVVLSMVAFDEFAADVATDSVVVGAGQTWGDVDRKLEGALPGYAGQNTFSRRLSPKDTNTATDPSGRGEDTIRWRWRFDFIGHFLVVE
jgi:cysteine desulfurase